MQPAYAPTPLVLEGPSLTASDEDRIVSPFPLAVANRLGALSTPHIR